MPINYQPPDPVSPYTSAAFGAAEEYDRLAPTIAAYRGQNLQAGAAGAQAYNQGQQNVTQRTDAAGQQNTALALQQQALQYQTIQEQNRANQQAQMLYAQQEQQAAELRSQQVQQQRLQDQHFQQQVEADRIHLSQVEQMQLQRYRNADGDIDKMLAEGTIDQETATELHFKNRNLAGPLELRAVKSRAMMAEAEAKNFQAQADFKHQQALKQAKIEAMTIDERTMHVPDPNVRAEVEAEMGPFDPGAIGVLNPAQARAIREQIIRQRVAQRGGMKTFIMDSKGDYQEVKHDATRADPDKLDNAAASHWLDAEKKAAAYIDREMIRAEKENPENGVWWRQPGRRDEAIANELKRQGLPADVNQYIAQLRNVRARGSRLGPAAPAGPFAMPGGAGPINPLPTGAPQGGPQPPQQNAAPKFADLGPRFDPADLSKATEPQRKLVSLWQEDAKAVSESALPPARKQSLQSEIQWSIKALADHGSVEKMPPDVKQMYLAVQAELAKLPRTPTPQEQAHDQRREESLRNTPPAVDWKNKFDRGEWVTSDDIPGVPFIKRQFK